jgi:aryl-alcohol dehydrogenase-like predicted oxidoreductase
MDYVRLGRTGLKISRLALGCNELFHPRRQSRCGLLMRPSAAAL